MRRGGLFALLARVRRRIRVPANTGLGEVKASMIVGSWTQTRHVARSGPAVGPVYRCGGLDARS
jgi:hypothetical protein